MSDVAQWILAHPWAITREMLLTIIGIANRESAYEDVRKTVAAQDADPLMGTRRAEIRDRVAILNILGPIFPRANLFTALSGATSVQTTALDFNAALSNRDVDAILINFGTPGGNVDGINEFSAMIRAARGTKPIYAYVGSQACSAGYWIASACDQIIVDKTAMLGSIGVIMATEDTKARDEKSGIKRYEIVSSNAPNKRPDISTDAGRAQIQKIIDDTEAVFLSEVATNRGVTVDDVLQRYGQGGVFVGQLAVEAGLADATGSFEGTLSMLSKKNKTFLSTGGFMNLEELKANHPAVYAQVIAEGEAKGRVAGKEEGLTEGKALGMVEGVTQENKRVQAIQALGAKAPGYGKVIAEALADTSVTADQAAGKIIDAQAAFRSKAQADQAADSAELNKLLGQVENMPTMDATADDKALASAKAAAERANKSRGR